MHHKCEADVTAKAFASINKHQAIIIQSISLLLQQ